MTLEIGRLPFVTRPQRALDRLDLGLDRLAAPLDRDTRIVDAGELERVHLAQHRLPAPALDPRGRAQRVEQLGHLLGRLLDHPEEPPRTGVLLVHAVRAVVRVPRGSMTTT